jgi:hypothetical protein
MPLALASVPSRDPSGDLHADYLDYLRRTGRGNLAYARAARAFFERWPDPRGFTFTAVAAATGLGRSTLYRDPTIRAVIAEHRHHTATSGTLPALTDQIATLRAALDALAERVRRHEEQLRRLDRKR